VFGHRPARIIADRLTREGLAVLRTDDRGTGKTKGALGTLETDIGDARAAFEWLLSQPEVDRKRVGVIGHSVGGMIAPTIAARTGKVAFVVALAGPGVVGWQVISSQTEALALAAGAPADIAARIGAAQRKVSQAVATGDQAKIVAALRASVLDTFQMGGQPAPEPARLDAIVAAKLPGLVTPWNVSFNKADPFDAWKKVKCPVLALIGDKDRQVLADANLARINAALEKAHNRDVTTRKLPGLNHLYQHAGTGVIEEYGAIEESFDPATLDLLAGWVKQKARL